MTRQGEGEIFATSNHLPMRRRPVDRRGLTRRKLGIGDTVPQRRQLALHSLDNLPLLGNGGVEILNRLLLMGSAHFQFIEAGCGVGHGREIRLSGIRRNV